VLNWRHRAEFLLGRFEYRDCGIMDDTHLRFYTFETGRRLLEGNGLRVTESKVEGSFPLRYIRRILPGFARSVDRLASEAWPGLFGYQLLYLARPADGCR
jgi:hypothetical protein